MELKHAPENPQGIMPNKIPKQVIQEITVIHAAAHGQISAGLAMCASHRTFPGGRLYVDTLYFLSICTPLTSWLSDPSCSIDLLLVTKFPG